MKPIDRRIAAVKSALIRGFGFTGDGPTSLEDPAVELALLEAALAVLAKTGEGRRAAKRAAAQLRVEELLSFDEQRLNIAAAAVLLESAARR
ncbi:MAG: hypothetical protein Q7T61_19030 [Caulobacter sp.]|nr:hypothetical protein [Caulobacter sp.]